LKKIIFLLIFLISTILNLFCETDNDRPRIGLALSGGGAKGIAHIGVLKVLEELDIKVDYIAGTSMGSIVGGLYSVGYRAQDLEDLVHEQDWDTLILDKIARRNVSIEEKGDLGKYAGSFPIRDGGIGLPEGLVAGQKIQTLISELTISAHHIEQFDQLPIPFLCLATDIEKGEIVVLDHGFLPDAIRASMSIPSAFTPIEIEGQLLVDGGLVRNFPVSDVINMGADIVIGVDVGAPLYQKKDLNSLVRILNQSISLLGAESTKEERNLADILIEPQVDEYAIMDFSEIDSLITRGERAARKMYPILQNLSQSLKQYGSEPETLPITQIDSIYIKKIQVQGLRDVSKNLINGKLQMKNNSWIRSDELTDAMERIYGSGFFKRVSYKLEPASEGMDLFVRVVERSANFFRFGLHYDSDMNSSVLLNLTFRNLLIQGSKFSIDYKLSEFEAYKLCYFIHTGWKPGFGIGFIQMHDNFDVSLYNSDGELEAKIDYSSQRTRLELQTILSNSFNIGGALEFENSEIAPILVPDYYYSEYSQINLLNLIGFLNIDTLNRTDYPQFGVKLYGEICYSHELEEGENKHEPITSYLMKYKEILQMSDKVSVTGEFKFGYLQGEEIPSDSYFYLGGLQDNLNNLFSFAGYEFMAIVAKSAGIFETSLQYEPWREKFITLTFNYARVGWYLEDLYNDNDYYFGGGIGFGILTPIGPMEYTIMKGNEKEKTISYINIGYQF
jgi:NTE family protein